MKSSTKDREILIDIYRTYILGIPQIRVLLPPTIICMLVSRYFEVKISELTQKVSLLFISGNYENRAELVFIYFLVASLSCLLIELQGFIFTGSVQRAFRVASRDTFKHFISLEHNRFHELGSGEIQTAINRKGRAVSEIIDVLALNFFPTILVIILTNIKIFRVLGTVPAIIINTTLIVYSVVTIRIAIWRNKMRIDLNNTTDRSTNKLYDSLTNYDTVSAFMNEELETERFDETLKNVERNSNKLWRSFYFLNFLQRLTFSMQTFSIILFGSYGLYMEKMKADTFILYLTITKILASNLDKLGYMYSRYSSAIINARLSQFNTKRPKKAVNDVIGLKNTIEFRNVSFFQGAKCIFRDVNFKINKGEKVALVGKNGCGKSTLMKMVLRQYNYDGYVLFDNEDVKYLSSTGIRSLVGYVQQDAPLFNDTVRFNMKYGNLECADYYMMNMCKRIDIHDSIMRLKEGYDTFVGERGKFLSGGERQKIALMRAVLKDTEVMFMDEPTGALDKEAELKIMKNLFEIGKNKTMLVITHNFDLLRLFDRILCFSNGSIKELEKVEDLYNEKDLILW